MAIPTSENLNRADGATHEFKNKIMSPESNLEKMSHDAGKKIGSLASNFADSTSEYVNSGREYIKENPAKGIAIAAAAGLVTGSLLTFIMKRK